MHVSSACGEVAVVNETQALGADVDVVLNLIDEGSQYTWVAIATRCREMRVQLSMRSVGETIVISGLEMVVLAIHPILSFDTPSGQCPCMEEIEVEPSDAE